MIDNQWHAGIAVDDLTFQGYESELGTDHRFVAEHWLQYNEVDTEGSYELYVVRGTASLDNEVDSEDYVVYEINELGVGPAVHRGYDA